MVAEEKNLQEGFKTKTMKRDLARLRLSEAEDEREKISKIKSEPVKKPKPAPELQVSKEQPVSEPQLVQTPKTPDPQAERIERVMEEGSLNQIKKHKEDQPRQQIQTPKQEPVPQASQDQAPKQEPAPEMSRPETKPQSSSGTPQDRVAVAKERLEALKKSEKKKGFNQENDYRESLKSRWADKKGVEVPKSLKKPVKTAQKYPSKPSKSSKKLVRGIIIFIGVLLLALIGFFIYKAIPFQSAPQSCEEIEEQSICSEMECFWYEEACHKEEKPQETACRDLSNSDECQEEECFWYEEACHENEITSPPPSLMPVDKDLVLSTDDGQNIGEAVTETLAENMEQGQWSRVLFRDSTNNLYLDLDAVWDSMEVKHPEELIDEATIVVYGGPQGNRMGFVIKTDNSVDKWEDTMVEDLSPLLSKIDNVWDREIVFKDGSYKGVSFRYADLNENDFGLCWAVLDDKLIITTSGSSIIKIIDIYEG